ncbi:hypothetical protein [Paraburkholderia sp. BL6669N2]|uniref:hypothetical protein n=1 Tax=Paraburkholderia sp. BL6669N2 TaxID=1938807 RepID=UPI0021615D51|nr:hypothetical protein [Paraburkholderia sp. BL6669N2]
MFAEVQVMTERSHTNWCIAHEDFDGAATRLRPLIALCDEQGWQRHVAHFQIQGALVDSRRGRPEATREAVLAALRRGHRLGLSRSLLDAGLEALTAITEVEQSEPHDPTLSFYVSRLQSAQQSSTRSGAVRNTPADAPMPAADPRH